MSSPSPPPTLAELIEQAGLLADGSRRVELAGGSTLFADGDAAEALYVIVHGRVRVVRDSRVLAELGPGETVGEMALLTGRPRHGSVVAARDTVLYRLDRRDFDEFCADHPDAMRTMLTSLAERISAPPARDRRRVAPTNLVVVPIGDDPPAQPFATAFVRFLQQHVRAVLVEPPAAAPTEGMPAQELANLERAHDHVVVLVEPAPTEWTTRALRQADQILLVGRAGAATAPNATERWLRDGLDAAAAPPLRLVVVQRNAERTPTGTSRWLRERAVDSTHHVHLEWESHFARLARFLVGSPFGLVLSGGASRALAHIGVLRALREHGYPIDVIIGTSAGALIGGEYAMGWNPDLITRNNSEIFGGSKRKLVDLTPPFTSLIGSTRFNRALDEVFGDLHFEDLWMQFMCTTTDLTEAAGRTHHQGRIRTYVRASCSLPMVMPPVPMQGRLLADGGIMNNVPVDPLLERTDVGALVVVNVTNPFYTADEDYNYDDSLPLSRVLKGRFSPFGERLVAPGIFDVLMRSLEIGSKSLEPAQIAKANVYVRPDVSRFGYTDIDHLHEIADEGYRATVAALDATTLPAVPFG